ncbi:MAG: glycine--tRNA ligase [bacterium]
MTDKLTLEKIVSLAKRRGFVFQSSEIYGGLGSTYDFGPLGIELKNNLKKFWWQEMVQKQEDIVGFDAAILMHPKVWEASGHVEEFSDPLVECKKCHHRFKAEDLENQEKCPDCKGELTIAKDFNMMMETFLGPVQDDASKTYLRPETAQGLYVNFKNVQESMRQKLPFGMAQIGKAFRNEITPGNFIFRTREFEQMEMQYFVKPEEADKYFEQWKDNRMNWYINLGIDKKKLRFYEHPKDKLAHYAKAAVDIEYQAPWGWIELEGIHNRGDFDLTQHELHSKKDLKYFDQEANEKYIPWIIETSGGIDRAVLAVLMDSYEAVKGGRSTTTESIKDEEVVLRLPYKLAPYTVAVLPLSKKEPLTKLAKEILTELQKDLSVTYDEVASIGKRYRRQDEIGTPFCVTIDFDSLEDKQVTVRDRDSMQQDRVAITDLLTNLKKRYA